MFHTAAPAPPAPDSKSGRRVRMLRNVLVMATSGLVLYSKEFVHAVAQVSQTIIMDIYPHKDKHCLASFDWIAPDSVVGVFIKNDGRECRLVHRIVQCCGNDINQRQNEGFLCIVP